MVPGMRDHPVRLVLCAPSYVHCPLWQLFTPVSYESETAFGETWKKTLCLEKKFRATFYKSIKEIGRRKI